MGRAVANGPEVPGGMACGALVPAPVNVTPAFGRRTRRLTVDELPLFTRQLVIVPLTGEVSPFGARSEESARFVTVQGVEPHEGVFASPVDPRLLPIVTAP
jgi:hypothetical protein